MDWQQSYFLFRQGAVISAILASLPILVVLIMLGALRRPAWIAGLTGLAVSLLVALWFYGMPVSLAVSSVTYGAAFGLFPISWIIFWAIVLFRITIVTGKFDIIRESIGRLTKDAPSQALLIAFALGAFIEGAAGFGTPVAIAAAMLTGLGFSPFRASAICLLANTAPVAFGSIGTPLITLAATTRLPLGELSSAVAAICAPVALLVPAYMIFAMGGLKTLRAAVLPASITGIVFAVTQYVVATYAGPQLTDILASIVAMIALFLVCRFRPSNPMTPELEAAFRGSSEALAPAADGSDAYVPSTREVIVAWTPYASLVFFVLLWGLKPVQRLLALGTLSFAWPVLHDHVLRMAPITSSPQPYHAPFTLNLLSASGTSCMSAALCSAVILGVPPGRLIRLLGDVCRQLLLPIVTVVSVLAMAFLMNYSGATATLGLAFSSTGAMFPFFSAMLGWMGVFLTGSDTSSNALFGNLQVVTAERLHLSPVLMAAANSSGGVVGKMISLQTIAVAAAATGMSTSGQSKLFRFTLKHSLLLGALVGAIALLYSHYLHF